ncbi:MAG: hypothetical protein M1812_002655 [Candelaria pacifica]|nr:MAG: hypothetical protein M1812_002655 [Candelaria pacifica]
MHESQSKLPSSTKYPPTSNTQKHAKDKNTNIVRGDSTSHSSLGLINTLGGLSNGLFNPEGKIGQSCDIDEVEEDGVEENGEGRGWMVGGKRKRRGGIDYGGEDLKERREGGDWGAKIRRVEERVMSLRSWGKRREGEEKVWGRGIESKGGEGGEGEEGEEDEDEEEEEDDEEEDDEEDEAEKDNENRYATDNDVATLENTGDSFSNARTFTISQKQPKTGKTSKTAKAAKSRKKAKRARSFGYVPEEDWFISRSRNKVLISPKGVPWRFDLRRPTWAEITLTYNDRFAGKMIAESRFPRPWRSTRALRGRFHLLKDRALPDNITKTYKFSPAASRQYLVNKNPRPPKLRAENEDGIAEELIWSSNDTRQLTIMELLMGFWFENVEGSEERFFEKIRERLDIVKGSSILNEETEGADGFRRKWIESKAFQVVQKIVADTEALYLQNQIAQAVSEESDEGTSSADATNFSTPEIAQTSVIVEEEDDVVEIKPENDGNED